MVTPQAAAPTAVPVSPVSARKSRLVPGLIIFAGVIGLGILVGAAAYYIPATPVSAAVQVARWLHLPVAKVNGSFITVGAFERDRAALQTFAKYQLQQGSAVLDQAPSETVIREVALDRLIQNALLAQLAVKRSIQLSDADIDADFSAKVGTLPLPDVEKLIQQQFGMTIPEYKKLVVRPYLLQQKLASSIALDQEINKGLEERAQQVVTDVAASKDSFEQLATKYSEDLDSVYRGGDIGTFYQGDIPEEVFEAAQKLKPGERSGLVRSSLGYHILENVEAVEPGADGRPGIHVRQILLRAKTIDQWMIEQLAQSRVAVFTPHYRWDANSTRVVATRPEPVTPPPAATTAPEETAPSTEAPIETAPPSDANLNS